MVVQFDGRRAICPGCEVSRDAIRDVCGFCGLRETTTTWMSVDVIVVVVVDLVVVVVVPVVSL